MTKAFFNINTVNSSTNYNISPAFFELIKVDCEYCGGEGVYRGLKKVEDPCRHCDGRGWELDTSEAISGTNAL